MQILTIRTIFEDSKQSNVNLNHSIGSRSNRIQNLTIRKGFEAFEWKLEAFEQNSKHSNANSNQNSNHSKGIQSIRMQIITIREGFKAFECKFQPFE